LNFIGYSSFSLSGTTRTSAGAAIPAVTVEFTRLIGSGALPGPVQTDASGQWTQSGFEVGTTYGITPVLAAYTLVPPTASANVAKSLAFVGTSATFSASGTVLTRSGTPIAGAAIALAGSGNDTGGRGQRRYRTLVPNWI
jgi:hypothetical protein